MLAREEVCIFSQFQISNVESWAEIVLNQREDNKKQGRKNTPGQSGGHFSGHKEAISSASEVSCNLLL